MTMRKPRIGEVVCACSAYTYPHRQFGGKCQPQRWVCHFFDPHKRECKGCINIDGMTCQVNEGVEQPMHCPELRDYIRFEGIALYGRVRQLMRRATRGHMA